MNQWREQMKQRTHVFALEVLEFVRRIPDRDDTRELKDQLLRSASGIDLNWHAACCGRTHKEFTAKLGTVFEEADEAAECMALIRDGKLAIGDDVARLSQESRELRLIFGKATRTARANEEHQARERQVERRLSPFYLLPFTFDLALLVSSRVRVARRFLISGRVQGVGFRWFIESAAGRDNVHGWVRNLPDGRVEAHAEGDAEALERFERALRQGPPGARVETVDVDAAMPTGRDTGFSVT